MCGLFGGASSTLVDIEVDRVIQLGIIAQLRGTDSTGILTQHRASGQAITRIHKDTVNSSVFFEEPAIKGFIKEKRPYIIAGHCRAATVGEVTVENAHPYYLGKIAGMKNGTIHNLKGKTKDETDSQAFLRLIQDEGLEAAMHEAQGGGYAACWIDSRNQTLNFVRNGGRPLFLMKGAGCLYWSSEREMLQLIRDRTSMSFEYTDIEPVPINTHVSYATNRIMTSEYKKIIEVKPKTTWYPSADTKKHTQEVKKIAHTVMGPTVPLVPKPKGREILDVPAGSKYTIRAFQEKSLKPSKARKLLANGCSFCTNELSLGEITNAHFYSNKSWLCDECAANPFARLNTGASELFKCQIIIGECDGHC
jgi:glucosamine 6-phosphate synthetase-like amidotransferase/phosphosugar isomerase protein